MKSDLKDKTLVLYLSGHIDSANAPAVEGEISSIMNNTPHKGLELDCRDLKYLSSAGLRIILRLRKENENTVVSNVSPEVYEIFDMTGFTEMMDIRKAYRVVSVDGCEVIGQGANGKVYRIDPDTIVKVYLNPDSLPEIQRERELARAAFVLGIPTAIPYDVVSIEGGGYGSVFELLNAKSLAKLLASGEKSVDEVAKMSADLLKTLHSTVIKEGSMPDMKEVAVDWAEFLKDHLEPALADRLISLVKAVPDDMHMLHGDFHIKNVMLQNDEILLIDMDTLCHGHPIFELASMFNAYHGFGDLDHDIINDFLGISYETATELLEKTLSLYLGTDDPARIKEVEEKASVIGYTRIMRRRIRRRGYATEEGRAEIENCRKHLEELVPMIDTLTF
ncbi:MAG: anti-sigma factor antagonist [Firmicutes bacterium]|nr:anti-sigma factor antagonist [Bacillota bacterium]